MATNKTSNESSAIYVAPGCSDEETDHGHHAYSGSTTYDRERSGPMVESFAVDSSKNDPRSNANNNHNSQKSKSHIASPDHICEKSGIGGPSKRLKRSRGGATKRKDGRYVKYLELGKSSSGARIRKAFYGKTATIALAKYDRAKAAKLNGIVSLDDKTTFSGFVKIYLNDIARGKCKPGTLTGYQDLLDHHVTPTIGHMRLLDIRVMHIEKIFTQMGASGLSVGTIRAVRRVASSVFAAAVRSEMISSNPVAKTAVPKLRVGQKSRKPVPYTQEQLRQVVSHLSNRGFEAIFVCLIRTGM